MSLTISDLPHKEQTLFRSALKLYEVRQYKKGLKTCDLILKTFPNHGETLAVKGMFLSNMERKEEAYEHIKRGIEINPNSSISWHVSGIVNRGDQKYEEALECYEKAAKVDSENVHILRDLSQLQIHFRQYEKLVVTRTKLAKLNPLHTVFWLGLAIVHQMLGRYDLALKAITSHEGNLKHDTTLLKNEISEVLMYKNWLMELNGDYQQALENLKEIRLRITDITAWKEQKANLLLKVERREAAAMAYQELIERNPDNNAYVRGYLACNGLDMACADDKDTVLEVIDSLQQQFPSSNTLKFLPLTFCEGDSFISAAETLAKHALRKGIPSLFTSFKTLYANEAKGAALGRLMEGYATQLRDTSRFSDSTDDEPATASMWSTFYMAQHADYYGDYERALQLIEDAIRAAPDTVELYMVKAKILKHAGDVSGARNTMDFARQMDLKDRFVNSKTVKYMLRNNDVEEAEKMMVMFVRDDAAHKIQEIVDMQAIWYMHERGDAYRRLGDIGRALKQYHQVQFCFDSYQRVQFDFHSYSLRKATVRSYVDILQWEDQVYSHNTFVDAAHAAIDCYVDLHDRKLAGAPFAAITDEGESRPLTRNGSAKQGQHNLSAGVGEAKPAEVDKDPSGATHVDAEDFMAEALKFVERLEGAVGGQAQTHLSSFEVHLRMQKYFLALKAINALKAIDEQHPSLVPMVVRMIADMDSNESFAAPMKAALKGQLAKSFGEVSIEASIEAHQNSLLFALAGAKGLLALGGEANVASCRRVLVKAASPAYGETRTLDNLLAAKAFLEKSGASEAELSDFGASAKLVFPLATCF
ncbi:hypothetical protein H4218_000225 [Coemansia sp. IMI 209128]|nr:hypothetical protein H4218_000225 [Coemansia sp. IMI 209128]